MIMALVASFAFVQFAILHVLLNRSHTIESTPLEKLLIISKSKLLTVHDLDTNLLIPGIYNGPQIPCNGISANNNSRHSEFATEDANADNITAIFFMSARYT
jgi:hypothetical protein